MNLVDYARNELELAGWFDEDGFYGSDMGTAVLELVEKFSAQDHSGTSAFICLDLFKKVANYEPLGPLTGNDDEWEDISDRFFVAKVLMKEKKKKSQVAHEIVDQVNRDPGPSGKRYQNKRCARVFKDEDGRPYDSAGILWRNNQGVIFRNKESRVYITFPYMPTQEIREIGK